MPTKCMDWMEISRFLGWLCSNVYDRNFILNGKWIVKGLGFLGKHSMNIFLIHSFYRDVFFHEFTYSFYYAWLDYIVLMAISLVTSIVLEWFKKLIRYEKFIDWVKRLVTKEGVTVH